MDALLLLVAADEAALTLVSDDSPSGIKVTITVGHPVSAMYMSGWLDRSEAGSTLLVLKKSQVQAAESSIETPPNHGCTLDNWTKT